MNNLFQPILTETIFCQNVSFARAIAAAAVSLVLATAISAQSPPTQSCSSTSPAYCTGVSNPVGAPKNSIVFPADNVMVFAPGPSGSGQAFMNTLSYDGNYDVFAPDTQWGIPGAFSPSTTYAAAAGRIIAPGAQTSGNFGYPEDVVYAWRNGNTIQVDFANPAHAAFGGIQLKPEPWDGTQIVPRPDATTYGTSTDYVAVAVGDLDGVVDANGEPHDEVVVAFPVIDAENTWKIEVYVLNFTNATDASGVVITENNTPMSACGLSCYASTTSFSGTAQNQGAILSSGNMVSLAIGDFDGDGTNEIASAHVADGTNMWISLFRYWNGGNVANSNLWRYTTDSAGQVFNQFDQQASQIDQSGLTSNIGSVSLIAGDFNNDGKDELALGYGLWGKNSTHQVNTQGEMTSCVVNIINFTSGGELGPYNCDYRGYALTYTNYITTYQTNMIQVNPTGISAGTTTSFALPNAHERVTGRIFIQGGTGDWKGINGSFPLVGLSDQGFQIAVDSSKFSGTPNLSAIWVTTPAALSMGSTATINPRADNPGQKYKTTLPSVLDFRDNNSRPVMQLAAGLFSPDPNADPGLQQRQIMAIWNTPSPADYSTLQTRYGSNPNISTPLPYWPYDLDAAYVTVSTDGNLTPTVVSVMALPETPFGSDKEIGNWYGYPHQRISITASNFAGAYQLSSPNSDIPPAWSFLIGAWLDSNNTSEGSGTGYHVRTGSISNSAMNFDPNLDLTLPNGNANGTEYTGSFPVVAYDSDGSSYFLSTPTHLVVSSFQAPGFILQEPPKEMFWQTGSSAAIDNINRNANTFTSVLSSTTATNGTQQTSSGGEDYGASLSLSAGATLQGGNPLIISSKLSVQDTLGFKYQHSRQIQKMTNQSSTQTFNAGTLSANDDYLEYSYTNYDIWRYRVYGAGQANDEQGNPDSANPYKYYELVIPRLNSTKGTGSGQTTDWYRPMHENGNILSYPAAVTGYIPTDLSPTPYQVDGQTPSGVTNGLLWQHSFQMGNLSGPQSVTITGVTGSSKSVQNSNSFQEDNDLKINYNTSLADSYSMDFSADIGFSAKQSFSKANVTSNSVSASNTFGVTLSTVSDSWPYTMQSTLYNSLSGSVKMAYTVQLPNGCDNQPAWCTYFQSADPGLLMPKRWNSSNSTWELQRRHFREETKSLVMLNSTVNPIDGTNDLLGVAPSPGQTVILQIPVYNFSYYTAAQDVSLTFSTIPVSDPALDPGGTSGNEFGCGAGSTAADYVCPNSYRTPLTVSVPAAVTIPAWNNDADNPNYVLVQGQWTIPASMANTKIRIYVNVNYNGTETYPPQQACTQAPCPALCDESSSTLCTVPTTNTDPNAPGQNNEGYYDFWIGAAQASTSTPQSSAQRKVDVHTTPDSLIAINKKSTWNRIGFGFQGHAIAMRVLAAGDHVEPRHHRMFVTERNLSEQPKGKQTDPAPVAGKIIQGTNPNGSAAFFSWSPQTVGIHRLRAEVEEFADDTVKGNNKASMLELIFRAPGDVDGNGRVDSNDLHFLERDNGKRVRESECGYACDLNGDGWITRADQELLVSQCTSAQCAVGDQKGKPAAIEQVREFNRTEMEALRNLRLKDWSLFMREACERDLPLVESLYMRSIMRAATGEGSRELASLGPVNR